MSDYMPADEAAALDAKLRNRCNDIIDDAASWIVAVNLGLPQEIVDLWAEKSYVHLDDLSRPELTRTVMLLLSDTGRAEKQADRLTTWATLFTDRTRG
jgi:hypothetical protein